MVSLSKCVFSQEKKHFVIYSWNIFTWKRICGVRDEQARFSNSAVSHHYNFDVLHVFWRIGTNNCLPSKFSAKSAHFGHLGIFRVARNSAKSFSFVLLSKKTSWLITTKFIEIPCSLRLLSKN
jgi:hypothetical protein